MHHSYPADAFESISALVFDIGGTLADSTGSTIREFRRILGDGTAGDAASWDAIDRIALAVDEQADQRMERIRRGDEPFLLEPEIRREVLPEVLHECGVSVDAQQMEELVHVGERYDIFPDVARQLDALSEHASVIGLTNSALGTVTRTSARTGMRWHALLGTQLARSYKPDPAAYALVPELLGVDPSSALFISAHPWDLRGAYTAGFGTVYLPRPHIGEPEGSDRFDLTIDSLDDLVALLRGTQPSHPHFVEGASSTG